MDVKRGQISVFIIVGLILLMLFAAFFYFMIYSSKLSMQLEQKRQQEQLSKKREVQLFVESCLEDVSKDIIDIVALQGGYYYIEPKYFNEIIISPEESFFNRIYYARGKKDIPSMETVEQQISYGVEERIRNCLDFTNFNYEIVEEESKPVIAVSINQKDISLEMKHKITIREENIKTDLETFAIKIPSSFYTFYGEIAPKIISFHEESPGLKCLSCIRELVETSGYQIDSMEFEKRDDYFEDLETNTVLTLSDEHYAIITYLIYEKPENILKATPKFFMFSTYFDLPPEALINDMYIYPVADQEVRVGEKFSYKVRYVGEVVEFSDNTDLFDISKSGIIEFTPMAVGTYPLIITAKNSKGGTNSIHFKIEVK